jgi:transposase-like protein
MALSQSAVSELLEAFRAGDGVDLIRESVRMALQELIEVEAAAVIGAGRYERTATRTAERNGHRDRPLSTQAGDVSKPARPKPRRRRRPRSRPEPSS